MTEVLNRFSVGVEMAKPELTQTTTILLADEDLEMLRALAQLRARRRGGRVSQGAVVRDLIQREHARVKREAARA